MNRDEWIEHVVECVEDYHTGQFGGLQEIADMLVEHVRVDELLRKDDFLHKKGIPGAVEWLIKTVNDTGWEE